MQRFCSFSSHFFPTLQIRRSLMTSDGNRRSTRGQPARGQPARGQPARGQPAVPVCSLQIARWCLSFQFVVCSWRWAPSSFQFAVCSSRCTQSSLQLAVRDGRNPFFSLQITIGLQFADPRSRRRHSAPCQFAECVKICLSGDFNVQFVDPVHGWQIAVSSPPFSHFAVCAPRMRLWSLSESRTSLSGSFIILLWVCAARIRAVAISVCSLRSVFSLQFVNADCWPSSFRVGPKQIF